jgi:Glycosyltransferase
LPFLKKENRFVSVGRIGESVKNHDLIISAIDMLLESSFSSIVRDWEFFFVGPVSKSFYDRVIELSKCDAFYKDNIKLVGEVNDKPTLYQYYNKSKFMILPSLREGSPLVIPEALRMGNVVITTPVSSVDELVSGNGIILNDFTPETLSEAIVNCIQHAESQHFSKLSDKAIDRGKKLAWDQAINHIDL